MCLNDNSKDGRECSKSASDPDGFKILVPLHQLLLQLHDLGHGLILHVLQLLRHLYEQQPQEEKRKGHTGGMCCYDNVQLNMTT